VGLHRRAADFTGTVMLHCQAHAHSLAEACMLCPLCAQREGTVQNSHEWHSTSTVRVDVDLRVALLTYISRMRAIRGMLPTLP
jgi:hypothetical protein